MKNFVLLLAVLAVAFGQTCKDYFVSTDGYSYDLTVLRSLNTAVDSNGKTWYFGLCQSDMTTFCPEGSMVCSQGTNQGDASSMLFSDSTDDTSAGFEVTFGAIVNDVNHKVLINYVCDVNEDLTSTVDISDDTLTTITVTGKDACPESEDSSSMWDDDDFDVTTATAVIDPFYNFTSLVFCSVLLASAVTCCLCCCAARRRRCRQRAVAMRQFSNVAFQPVPTTQSAVNNAVQPAFNPYIAQPAAPQFVYYYPSQEKSDEQIAKELQAQFDAESRV
eukprot:TRINITY_DN380_c0_g1_i1.p1 TRINITY_DN380_c0_g1~~TRINITY_DN380_c0_g1_i1.p1  ORF type:complete len:276 (+),score=55.92 TRINITY_DN380_c0_g1_i1:145-972(+)